MPSEPIVAYFDGLAEPSPGISCAGWVCEGLNIRGHKHVGNGTNNQAEYQAALSCLRAIYKSGYRGCVNLRGDSQLVVKQFNNDYACHSDLLIPLLAQLRKAGTFFEELTLEWVPREANDAADAQSRAAYVAFTGHQPPERARKPKATPVPNRWAELGPPGGDLNDAFPVLEEQA